MPSGITSAIYDGKDVSLRDYLMTVGRQYGLAVLQRDAPLDEPVRVESEDSWGVKHHTEGIQDAINRAEDAREWTDEQAAIEAKDDYQEKHDSWVERRKEKRELRGRYEAMIEQVEGWQPKGVIAATQIKEGAIKYLRDSIQFDCGTGGRFDQEPQLVPATDFRQQVVEQAEKDVTYHQKQLAEEQERVRSRREAQKDFLASLPPESA